MADVEVAYARGAADASRTCPAEALAWPAAGVARRLRREASHHLSPLRVRQRDLERAGVLCGAEEELRGLLEGGQGLNTPPHAREEAPRAAAPSWEGGVRLDAAPPAGDVHSRAGAGLVWRRQLAQEQPGGGVREGGGVARHEGAPVHTEEP